MQARPEARTDVDENPDRPDEGGWLGPVTDWRSTPDPTAEHPSAVRRFDETDLLPPQTRHRGTLLAVLIGVAVLAVGGATALVLASPRGSPTGAPTGAATGGATSAPSASPTRFISAQAEGKPRDIRITEDRGTSVTVGWTDPTAGTVTFVVVGTGTGGEKLDTRTVQRGTTTVTYGQLSTKKNYCFVVGAVYAVDAVALANEVCTKR